MAEAAALALLVATLVFAIVRPRGLPEVAAALPAALLLLAFGVLSLRRAGDEIADLAPTVGFLAGMLVIGECCEREGLFAAAGRFMASAAGGSPRRLLGVVFAVASLVTAALSLDTTVVLLTPVVFATVARMRLRAKPHVYACVHLANSASLLLPVSNLSNLLAVRASGLSFTRFGALMALPWIAAIGVEYIVLRRAFAGDLSGRGAATAPGEPARVAPHVPIVLAATLAGFVVASAVGVDPAWAAAAGAFALAVGALLRRRASPSDIVRGAALPFCVFVLALGVIVRAAQVHGLQGAVSSLVPGGSSLGTLLAIAALAAVLANLVNNLPAILVLLPAVAPAGAGAVLAALIGVNVGPNLTYTGSLATLLWRRSLSRHGAAPDTREFIGLGAVSVPLALLAATVALWIALKL